MRFVNGFSDCVRCFSCGGGLRNWADGDIPWIEHARWYPNCDFLRQRKGDLFIQMHQQANDEQERYTPQVPSQSHRQESPTDEGVTETSASASIKEEIATRSVQEMGYSTAVIKEAVETLRKQGRKEYTATDIMQILLDKEESKTYKHFTKANTVNTVSTSGSADCASLLKENEDLKEQLICKICMTKEACVVYLPCGHMVTCQDCAPTIGMCCICRKLIQGTVRAYL